ncbi:MAG TPA: hypothetical protein VN408_35465 [Actinoplanes sp.]|nr:hypothetical protein [Actinoplanes sp.]
MSTDEVDEMTIMTPEQYHAAYLRIHGEPPPPEPALDETLPDCECRTGLDGAPGFR